MAVSQYPEVEANAEHFAAVDYPDESLKDTYEPGVTEPWIAELLCSLLKASGGVKVLETGGFRGITSAWLALTLKKMRGGHLAVCEIDPERREGIKARLDALLGGYDPDVPNDWDGVGYSLHGDVMQFLYSLADGSLDFVFCDDEHHPVHVEQEILLLFKKVRVGGLICFHDVAGQTEAIGKLVEKYGGISLDLPRLGPGGGLGIIQRKR